MNRPTDAINAYLDDQPSAEQLAELQAWIQADPANADAFLSAAQMHRLVAERVRQQQLGQAIGRKRVALDLDDADTADTLVELTRDCKPGAEHPMGFAAFLKDKQEQATRRKWAKARLYAGGALAAMLMLGIVIGLVISAMRTPQPIAQTTTGPGNKPAVSADPTPRGFDPAAAPIVATLTAEHDAVWSMPSGTRAPSRGDVLHPGDRLTLTAGLAKITTARGAVAILEAPATIELTASSNALRLHTGKLVGICETQLSKGFVVRTPHMDITDLGTRFGVDINPAGETHTHVFEGRISVASSNNTGNKTEPIVLEAGASITADTSGLTRPGNAQASVFANALMYHNGLTLTGDIRWGDRRELPNAGDDIWPVDSRAMVFEELRGVTLAQDAPVTFVGPGRYQSFDHDPVDQAIPAGTRLRTYFVIFKPPTEIEDAKASGTIRFSGEILGVTASESHNAAFVKALGPTDQQPIKADDVGARLESLGNSNADTLVLGDDRRTLSFELAALQFSDVLRVIVLESNETFINPDAWRIEP